MTLIVALIVLIVFSLVAIAWASFALRHVERQRRELERREDEQFEQRVTGKLLDAQRRATLRRVK